MLQRCKKWSDILNIASVGGGEFTNLKPCHFPRFHFQLCHQRSLLKCHCTFYIYGTFVKKSTFRFLKHALFIELSPWISWRTCEGQCLDILASNSANGRSIQNQTKSLFDQRSIDVKSAVRLLGELQAKTSRGCRLLLF